MYGSHANDLNVYFYVNSQSEKWGEEKGESVGTYIIAIITCVYYGWIHFLWLQSWRSEFFEYSLF